MDNKVTKTCSNCETKYTVAWDNEEQDLSENLDQPELFEK